MPGGTSHLNLTFLCMKDLDYYMYAHALHYLILCMIWCLSSLPLQIGVALYLQYTQVNYAFLSGLAITIILIPGMLTLCFPVLYQAMHDLLSFQKMDCEFYHLLVCPYCLVNIDLLTKACFLYQSKYKACFYTSPNTNRCML